MPPRPRKAKATSVSAKTPATPPLPSAAETGRLDPDEAMPAPTSAATTVKKRKPPARKSRGRVKIRLWEEKDVDALVACHRAAYQDYPGKSLFSEREFHMELEAFPEGQFLAELDGEVVGYAACIIVQLEDDTYTYTYTEITGGGTFSTHDPGGDTLYGADIAVHPAHRGKGIAGLLYKERKRILKRYNLRRMIAYGRLPGYQEMAGKMTAEQYVQDVIAGTRKDPALNAHLKAGYTVERVLLDFMRDAASMNYSTLLEMPNVDFKSERRSIAGSSVRRPVRKIRVCAAQFQMRPIRSWEDFEHTVDFFVDTADTYHCHFLLLPEYFTAQLISLMPADWDDRKSINELADMTDRYLAMLKRMAREHDLYIIGGSHPIRREGKLFNVAHLFTPAGNVYTQDKLHITPSERRDYGIEPGEGINVFETPFGRIGIQICYDIEFPEVSRLLTLAGVEVIFVPYSTDERKAYFRVRSCGQARAVENYIYVVLAGNVGNLPNVASYLINYGQAAIFTPSDFAFPMNAVAAEAEPNIETVVISDLDLHSLQQMREIGSVRPLYDRRPDLYKLTVNEQPINIIRVE